MINRVPKVTNYFLNAAREPLKICIFISSILFVKFFNHESISDCAKNI